jgi:hypothetical protein
VSDKWGDEIVCSVADYERQAEIFGCEAEIESNDDGVWIDGELVGIPIKETEVA